MKNYFEEIPPSLEEAAQIDGANDIYILIRIILPLALPTIATLTLFYAVGWWNSYMNVILYIQDSNKINMSAKLIQMVDNFNVRTSAEGAGINESTIQEGITATSIVIAMVPILCIYPFLQKYFVKGIMVGSVKG
jgi:putative aldouronate transport system permease protein